MSLTVAFRNFIVTVAFRNFVVKHLLPDGHFFNGWVGVSKKRPLDVSHGKL